MKTDRELLELAAKAACYVVWSGRGHQEDMLFMRLKKPDPTGKCSGREWNPLSDDGDALRLAAVLDIDVFVNSAYGVVQAESICGDYLGESVLTEDRADYYRHAILRCAAAIGEAMQ